MRWLRHSINDSRVVKRFLLFPKCIGGEWRWLEVAYIKQKYAFFYTGMFYGEFWKDFEWVESETK